jgi:WD40 repeat protein
VLRGHRDGLESVEFSTDGLVVSAASDAVRVWDPSRSISRLELAGFEAGNLQAIVNGDTTRVAAADSTEGVVRVWDCEVCGPIDDVIALAETRATRELTPEEEETFAVGES